MTARVSGLALFGNNSQGAQAEIAIDSVKLILKGKRKNQWVKSRDFREVTTRAQLLDTKLTVTTHAGRPRLIGSLNKKHTNAQEWLIHADCHGAHGLIAHKCLPVI